jgi:threonine synthase
MTTCREGNIQAIAVEGTFDDCQGIVKAMFADQRFRERTRLSAVNSINFGRIVAQIVYYFTAAVALGGPHRPVSFTVPTGNFGNVFAGYAAKRMGLPVERLVVATNVNDILDRTLTSGRYEIRGVTPSSSPSMDIAVSSNFERLLYEAEGRDPAAVRRSMSGLAQSGAFSLGDKERAAIAADFASGSSDEAKTALAIKRQWKANGILLDPHTAVGVGVAEQHLGRTPMITHSTAHPAKFPDAVEAACGKRPPYPEQLARLLSMKENYSVLPADLAAIERAVEERVRAPEAVP